MADGYDYHFMILAPGLQSAWFFQAAKQFWQRFQPIVTDDWEGCKHMGSLQPFYERNLLSEVYADISEIAGGGKPGRETEDERIVYVPMGMGSEDIAMGWHVYNRAMETGRGSRFSL